MCDIYFVSESLSQNILASNLDLKLITFVLRLSSSFTLLRGSSESLPSSWTAAASFYAINILS